MQLVLPAFVIHWYISLFSQTFFLHRYSAHKMFVMNKFWEKFFYFLTYLSQGSSFLSPRAYAILHRMHHAFSDTKKDPHSPMFSSNVFTMMWKTKDIYNAVLNRKSNIEERFEHDYPVSKTIEKIGDSWISRVGWGVAYSSFYIIAFIYFDMHWAFIPFVTCAFFNGTRTWCYCKLVRS
jgi:stearoyl-CoA desaturase (delta-9 desaturase)